MVGVSKKTKKAATLMAMTVLMILVLNIALASSVGRWSLLEAIGLTTLLMWPVLHHFLKKTRYAGIFYKIDSKKGLKFIDKEGARHARFWTAVGDFALIIFFAGLGTAFVVNHASKRGRRIILSVLALFSTFVYLGPNLISIFPMGFFFSNNFLALLAALLVGQGVFRLADRLSVRNATILSFFLAAAVFGSPYLLDYITYGDVPSLAMGLVLGTIGLIAVIVVPLAMQAINLMTGASKMPGLNPGYPEVENGMPVLKYAGTNISIPFFPDILIAFVIMIALHELFHGLVARAQGIPLKNTGLLFLSIIPAGAFVEPDEKQFKKAKRMKQLRVYAVGSFANMFVVAVAILLIGSLILSAGIVKPEGFIVGAVVTNSSAYGVINPGDVVKSVGGVDTLTFADFAQVMKDKKPGQNLTIVTEDKTVSVTLTKNPNYENRGFVGLQMFTDPILSLFAPSVATSQLEPSTALTVFNILKWTFFLNLMLGIMNLLPIKVLDGGFIYDGLFLWLESKVPHGKRLRIGKVFSAVFTLVVLAAFIINFSPYLP